MSGTQTGKTNKKSKVKYFTIDQEFKEFITKLDLILKENYVIELYREKIIKSIVNLIRSHLKSR